MRIIEKKISKENKYLYPDILKEIPSNTILWKTLPGLGATYSEIEAAQRNSIIIEPNVPVIVGKEQKEIHKGKIIGVYEGVTEEKILEYLKQPRNRYKIITTPESYIKVKKAVGKSRFSLYNDFFLLFDECERITTDIDYRKNIDIPMDDFFKFKQKAFVSATPIIPRDPRFEQDNFSVIKIIPDYDYRQNLDLITTNDIVAAVRKTLNKTSKEHICFFVNSTDTIEAIINTLNIKDSSVIFCSGKSKETLEKRGVNNISTTVAPDLLKKYSFFTSRFYSAVDIELDYKPDVIMTTDLYYASHSTIDPFTEAIQIVGRFRNGVNSITHISNINKHIVCKTDKEILLSLAGWREAYLILKNLAETTSNPASKELFEEAMGLVSYSDFIDDRGKENFFLIDNYINKEQVKAYYSSSDNLLDAYLQSNAFIVDYVNIYNHSTAMERLKRKRNKSNPRGANQEIVENLESLESQKDSMGEEEYKKQRYMFANDFPTIVEAYDTFGKDVFEELDYSQKRIENKLIAHKEELRGNGLGFTKAIHNSFEVGRKYTSKEIEAVYEQLIEEFGYAYKEDGKQWFKWMDKYFEGDRTTKGKKDRAFLIKDKKV
ncbi:hypothetical protein D0T51_12160 [Parabacteroides sp. 52]|uniref:DEAD/DEAH box helicase family protein n=1 Tax=unclassified Parabacteroides TaxID=2649774 RepID=UPI0013D67F65|nr:MULTISPECIES: DEAD/DEAH box helicase family protein [unclassified Parabacteroides]MDH6535628.1 hypothetical protein [Parabacteroides sp. PM5-20]NDV56472.1 hypothetical protein [Parabacteroides sp. 52]